MSETVRVYFATDVHGSERVWRKWLAVPKHYKANILILAGDLTGKSIVPLIEQKDGTYACKIFGRRIVAHDNHEIEKIKEDIRFSGYYPIVCTPKEVEELKSKPKKLDELFEKVMVDNIIRWLRMVEEHVPKDVKVIVMPGNDDIFAIDEPIKKCERVIYPLGKAVPLCFDYEMISMDWTNPTPWNSPRECSEKELWKKLEKLVDFITVDWSRVICNFHCPPYMTLLDLAPKLDKDLKPVYVLGRPVREHVGSKSVREFEKKYQPLLGLHGHIHESYASDRVGSTLVVNPGSEYTEGILRGFILDFTKDKIERWWKVEG